MVKMHVSAPVLTGEVWSTAERFTPLHVRPAWDTPDPKRALKGISPLLADLSKPLARAHRQVAALTYMPCSAPWGNVSLAPVRPSEVSEELTGTGTPTQG